MLTTSTICDLHFYETRSVKHEINFVYLHVYQERSGDDSLISHLFSPSEHQPMQVGGLISTSNVLETAVKQVTVDTSHTLLWTMSHIMSLLTKSVEYTIMYYTC